MKQTLLIILSALLLMVGGKGLHVLVMTPTPQLHCESCENNIKKNLRFEKGVKEIDTDIKLQTVTVVYDARKNSVEGLRAAMKKIGYDTRVVSDKPLDKKAQRKGNGV